MAADPLPTVPPSRPGFDELLSTHARRVYGFVYRLVGPELVEDACQEVWIAVYRALPRFRGEARVTTWLLAIAARVCHKLTRRHRLVLVGEDDAPEPVAEAPGPEAEALRGELAQVVRVAIDQLPDGRREVVHLRQIEGLSYDEIARVLDIPVGTVRSRLHHGMARLAELLAPYLETIDERH